MANNFNYLWADFGSRRSVRQVTNAIVNETFPYSLYDLEICHLVIVNETFERMESFTHLLHENGFADYLPCIRVAMNGKVKSDGFSSHDKQLYLIAKPVTTNTTMKVLMANKVAGNHGGTVLVAKFRLRSTANVCVIEGTQTKFIKADSFDYNTSLSTSRTPIKSGSESAVHDEELDLADQDRENAPGSSSAEIQKGSNV